MQVTDTPVNLGTEQCLIQNKSGDPVRIGEFGQDQDDWFELAVGSAVTIKSFNNGIGVVSDGVSEIGILVGGTGIFPPAVDLGDVDLSGVQPLDSDLTAIAALTTTSYGRNLLTLANAGAADWLTPAAAAAAYQPLDSDLTAIAALTTTSYGRALLALADAAALGTTVGTEVFKQAQSINAQTGTTYTLALTDVGKLVTLSNASAITLTFPQNSSVAIPVGSYGDLMAIGAGQVTAVAGSGATLRLSGLTAKSRAQYARFAWQKIGTNEFVLFGDLAAS